MPVSPLTTTCYFPSSNLRPTPPALLLKLGSKTLHLETCHYSLLSPEQIPDCSSRIQPQQCFCRITGSCIIIQCSSATRRHPTHQCFLQDISHLTRHHHINPSSICLSMCVSKPSILLLFPSHQQSPSPQASTAQQGATAIPTTPIFLVYVYEYAHLRV
jgi:hypothetical protein